MHSDSNGPDARTSVKGASMPTDAWVAPNPGSRASKTDTAAPREASSQATADPTRPAPTTTTAGFGTAGSVARRQRGKPGGGHPIRTVQETGEGCWAYCGRPKDARERMPAAARLLRFDGRPGRSAAGRRTGHVSTQPPTPSSV